MNRPLRVVRRDGPVIVLDDGTILRLLDDSAAPPAVGDQVNVEKLHAPAAELERLAARSAN